MIRSLLVLLLLIVATGVFAGIELLRLWEEPLRVPEEGYVLDVVEGDTLTSVASRLEQDGVISHPRLLTLYGRASGLDLQIKRGEYLLPAFTNAESLLLLLQSGRVREYSVVLPEGITLAQAIAILHRQDGIVSTVETPNDTAILELVYPYQFAEGLFFPAAYHYTRGTRDIEILARAHRKMRATLDELWPLREENLPYKTAVDALIMASIVEKETGLAAERQAIAGVFVRRLNKGMRLQTDPTIIYGLGESFDGDLKRSHLRDDSNLFNTYRHYGLPPTPIALPGREALYAALHPAQGEALYFVARGDGGHVFSRTLKEHQAAVRKYQYRPRKNYRSSPGAQKSNSGEGD